MEEAKALITEVNPSDPTGVLFHTKPITYEKLAVRVHGHELRALVCRPGGGLAEEVRPVKTYDGFQEADTSRDLLKLVWMNGYQTMPPALAFLEGTGIKLGAVAMSCAQDSHDLVAVGATDFELELAVNALIRAKGGIAVACMDSVEVARRPTAPLSEPERQQVLRRYAELERKVKQLQTPLPLLLDLLYAVGHYDVRNLSSRLFV